MLREAVCNYTRAADRDPRQGSGLECGLAESDATSMRRGGRHGRKSVAPSAPRSAERRPRADGRAGAATVDDLPLLAAASESIVVHHGGGRERQPDEQAREQTAARSE